jgi:hypothetical protein
MVISFTPRSRIGFLVILFSAWLYAGAENSGIGVTLVNYTVDSGNSVDIGYTITINAEVTNYDTGAFSGTISFGLRSSSEVLTNDGIFGQPPYSGDLIKLGGGETVPAIFSVNVNYQYFAPGPDVVVVWPICDQPIADSIVIHVTVLDPPSGINPLSAGIFTYTVLSDRILLKTTNINFQQVRILDVLGQEVYQLSSNYISQVPLPALPRGIYICQLFTADGKRETFKILH